jgi:hypothetical protein
MDFEFWLILGLTNFIQAVIWILPVIAGIIMVRRGGKRPERFFLIGSALMVLENLVWAMRKIHTQLITTEIFNQGSEAIRELGSRITSVIVVYSVIKDLLFLAGMVFLVYAFWLKFKKQPEAVVEG